MGNLFPAPSASSIIAGLGYTPENISHKGAANGYAPLDSGLLVPISNIPVSAIQSAIKGSPSTLYAASTTWAAKPSAASYPAGTQILVTDVGLNGSMFFSDGVSRWIPVNNRFVQAVMDSPHGIAQTGTIGTGSSGNITLGTAMPKIYSTGVYLYLPAIATTPAITAGYYWCVMSSTTVGTLYASKGGAAIDFSAGSAYTGVTTIVELASTTIKANILGLFGTAKINLNAVTTSSGNAKNCQLWFGSGNVNGISGTSIDGVSDGSMSVTNRGVANRQTPTADFSPVQAAPAATSSVDTTADQYFGLKVTKANATEYFVLETAYFECIVP